MFEKDKEIYCPSCSQKNEKDYDLIVHYLRDNPGATIMEITTETGASLQSINCFIEEGSFSYIESKTSGEKSFNLRDDQVEFKTAKFHGRMRDRR